MSSPPAPSRAHDPVPHIEDYAVIGDTQTMALVGRDGSVDWLCLPRFDSPACFARLLGTDQNGRWQICPRHLAEGSVLRTRRRYRPGTLVLETEWDTATGTVRVTDAMPIGDGCTDLVRRVEGITGEVEMAMRWVVRFGYGSAVPWIRRVPCDVHGEALLAVGGPDALLLRGDILPEVDRRGQGRAHHRYFRLRAGEQVDLSLTWFPSHQATPAPPDVGQALADTEKYWTQWSSGSRYEGRYGEAVQRSLITLKAMTYRPTGGIVAAPTTSLPEQIGGPRNWDYRYCWLRDATLTLHALLSAGYTDEAQAWRGWLLRAVAGSPAQLQILYGISGERLLPELELGWLPGYEGSAPVRIGNQAAGQFQLDVFGEVLNALHLAREAGLPGDGVAWSVQRVLIEHLRQVHGAPDSGLWEMRGPLRHFTYSKVMAWVGFDRMVRQAEKWGLPGPVEQWRAERDDLHAEICARGWNERVGAFTQYYDGDTLDASLLVLPSVGFLPGDDPRVLATLAAVERTLRHGPLVDRYQTTPELDGLPPGEGSFLACSFWLVSGLALAGRLAEARELFEQLLELRNDVGLLAEEYDGALERMTGNFPQAFSHLALVDAATTLEEAERGGSVRTGRGTTTRDGRAPQEGRHR